MTVVVERIPPSVNNMDVLNEYFGRFGAISAMHIVHSRHEALVTFARLEDAEEALRHPVLNDPRIGLRPWRSKGGADPNATHSQAAAAVAAATGSLPLRAYKPLVGGDAAGGGFPPSAGTASSSQLAVAPAAGGVPDSAPRTGNMELNNMPRQGPANSKRELEDRRKKLLQGLTDQLKLLMAKLADPKTTERQRETMQELIRTVRDRMAKLTPQQPQPPQATTQWPGSYVWYADQNARTDGDWAPGKGKGGQMRADSKRRRHHQHFHPEDEGILSETEVMESDLPDDEDAPADPNQPTVSDEAQPPEAAPAAGAAGGPVDEASAPAVARAVSEPDAAGRPEISTAPTDAPEAPVVASQTDGEAPADPGPEEPFAQTKCSPERIEVAAGGTTADARGVPTETATGAINAAGS